MIYFQLFFMFFKVGLFTIGGGYAMLPLIQTEVVGAGFLTMAEVWDMVAVAQMTPGAFALNISTFTGMKTAGVFGAIVATFGVLSPSLLLTTVLAIFFNKVKNTQTMRKLFYGMRPAIVGLIGGTLLILVREQLFADTITSVGSFNVLSLVLAVASSFAIIKLKVNPVLVILGCGLVGLGVMSLTDLVIMLQ